jgi:putative oxidoreductase
MWKWCFSSPLNGDSRASAGYALARVFVGCSMAFAHGFGKLPPPQMMLDGMAGMGLPFPTVLAWCAALAEVVGALLIAIGLLTRPAALVLGFTMAVAGFVVHGADPFSNKELALLYLAFCVIFGFVGAGKFSVDAWLSQKSA